MHDGGPDDGGMGDGDDTTGTRPFRLRLEAIQPAAHPRQQIEERLPAVRRGSGIVNPGPDRLGLVGGRGDRLKGVAAGGGPAGQFAGGKAANAAL